MTSPHQDAANSIEQLGIQANIVEACGHRTAALYMRYAAELIEQQAKALSEASQTCNSYSNRALAAEARLAEAMGVIERDIEALTEADTQIEYLHDKFKPTGSGMNALARIDIALTAARAYAAKEKA